MPFSTALAGQFCIIQRDYRTALTFCLIAVILA